MEVIEITCVVLLSLLSAGVAYLYFLALISLLSGREEALNPGEFRALVLVPAHNEEKGIAVTLKSLLAMVQPGKTSLVVIADNCTDQTAKVARESGVEALERFDDTNRGKGFALEWALARLNLNEYDAVAIVDADTIVRNDMLVAMADALKNHGAVQLDYRFTATTGEPLSELQEMASCVENMLFYRGRDKLGLPTLLRGTGMAIRTDVIEANPWDSHSITEDVDYAVNLIRRKISIAFSSASAVDSAATSTYRQFQGQKKRWASGTLLMIREKALPLLGQGLRQRRPELIELALSFFLLSRPTLILTVLPALVLAILTPDPTRSMLITWSLGLMVAIVAYLLLGIFFVRSKWRAIKALIYLPIYALYYLRTLVSALLGHKESTWVRTDRD